MSDISVKIRADALGKSLENITPRIEQELNQAVKNLAQAAYASMIAQIQAMGANPKNRQDYLRGLKFRDLGSDTYLIYLDGEWANKLESGFGSYNLKDVLLKSKKTVEVGSRAGLPWVRKNKKGGKYAAVPFEHKPFSGEKFSSGDLAKDIKKLQAMNRQGKMQPITKIFKDLEGKPLAGKVASVPEVPDNKNLSGLTKYQHVSKTGKVSSIYMTYRMVGENSKGWTHPGFAGYNIFKKAEEYIEQELDNIIKTLL